jgi:hypothetical protein
MSVTEMPFTRVTDSELRMRVDLAACYRLVDLFGWSDLINTRITARVPGRHDIAFDCIKKQPFSSMSVAHTWCPPYSQDQLCGQPPANS